MYMHSILNTYSDIFFLAIVVNSDIRYVQSLQLSSSSFMEPAFTFSPGGRHSHLM